MVMQGIERPSAAADWSTGIYLTSGEQCFGFL